MPSAVAYAKRMERRSIGRRIAAGSEDVDYLPTTNGAVVGEERNYRTNNSSNASVGAITSQAPPPNSTRLPLPPTTRTTVDFTARLAPPPARRQTAISLIASIFKKKRQKETFTSSIEEEQPVEVEPRPTSFGLAHIFSHEELKEATSCFKQQIGDGGFSSVYLVAYAKRMERRSIGRRIAAGSEDVDYLPTTNGAVAGEERNHRTNNSSNASVGAITSQAPPPNSTRPPLPPTTRTTVDFTARLAPPPARRQTAISLISSIFKKKRQKETFASSIEEEQPVEVEPRPTSFGLALIFSYEELKEATSCFKQQIGDGGFSSVYLVAYAKRMECRSIARRKAAGSEDVDYLPTTNGVVAGEELDYRTNHLSNASVGAITSQAPPPNSTRPPLPPTTRTTVDFTARLAPPPARRQTAIGLIASIFKKIASIFKKKRQKENFASSIEKEQPVEVEPRPTSFGLAHIFSYEELKEATSCFKQQIGDGGFSSVYLGKLPDQRMVAVKVLYEGIPKRFEQFINEVTILSRIRHKNLVVLYGCTDPETKKLLLVYEFVPNGTIADHLHGKLPPLTWALRIQMAIETAETLAYLHSLEPHIIHRDVKTSNILLDNDFHVKVADLGMCRLLPWDTKSVTTQPQGTQGYRDPEYELYCNLTDKSDVYSFGVVLLELLSGQQAVDVNREKNDIYLFRMALNKILNKELEQLVDPKLGYHSDCEIKRMIDLVAELACICLQPEAEMRPSMLDVVSALKKIYNDM